ncbi:MAG: hypothetical protein C0394_07315 [Syntrophus sp. (in: bacteria)]|nr:hypothetical protein [Syntrophus sp. (in: bacteria)]
MIFPDTGFQSSFLQHATAVRIGCFLGIFLIIAIMEIVVPRRPLIVKKSSPGGTGFSERIRQNRQQAERG